MPDPALDDVIRKYQCECFCTFYLPVGIEPNFCPHCGGECSEIQIMKYPDDGGLGQYLQDEDE